MGKLIILILYHETRRGKDVTISKAIQII